MTDTALAGKFRSVKALLLDVDGVLTDGRIVYDSRGRDSKFFDVHDGMGVALLAKAGIPTAFVSAKASRTLRRRARDMSVEVVFENVSPKTRVLDAVMRRFGVTADELCFMGDDLVDICLMRKVGLPIAVANACAEVKDAAVLCTVRYGGRGAVREVAELILKAQGRWDALVRAYSGE